MKVEPCRYGSDDRVAYAYGEMAGEPAEAFRTHLEACQPCREEVADLERAARLCREAREAEMAEPVWTRPFEPAVTDVRGTPAPWRRPVAWAAAVMAVGLLLVLVLWPEAGPRPDSEAPAATRTALTARVASVEGSAFVRLGAKRQPDPLTTDSPLFAGDVIETRTGGSAVLELDDESVVLITPATAVTLAAIGPGGDRLSVTRGGLACRVAPRAGGRLFEVHAGPGIARVVGTVFAVRLADDGALSVGVAEGKVKVGYRQPKFPAHLIQAGQQIVVFPPPRGLQVGGLREPLLDMMSTLAPAASPAASPADPTPPPPSDKQARVEPAPAPSPAPLPTPVPPADVETPPPQKEESIETLEALVTRLHQDTRWIFDELRIKMAEGRCDQVLRYLDDYLADPGSPNREEAVFLRGVCLEKLGKIREAHRAYRRYLTKWPVGRRAREAKHGLVRTRKGL